MVPPKRTFIAAASALAATLALAGCGSDDYGLSSADSAAIGAPAAGDETDTATPADELAGGAPTGPADTSADDGTSADDSQTQAKPVGKVTNKLIAKTIPQMEGVVTDAKGWILYRFDKDKTAPAKSNCVDDCAKLWPPLLADDALELDGISANKVSTVERADGGQQVTIGDWPVYRYLGDKKPGQWRGQNVGGTWFVIQKNGKKNLTCLPKVSKAVALPTDTSESAIKEEESTGELAAVDDTSASGY